MTLLPTTTALDIIIQVIQFVLFSVSLIALILVPLNTYIMVTEVKASRREAAFTVQSLIVLVLALCVIGLWTLNR